MDGDATNLLVVKYAEISRDQAPLRCTAHPNIGLC